MDLNELKKVQYFESEVQGLFRMVFGKDMNAHEDAFFSEFIKQIEQEKLNP